MSVPPFASAKVQHFAKLTKDFTVFFKEKGKKFILPLMKDAIIPSSKWYMSYDIYILIQCINIINSLNYYLIDLDSLVFGLNYGLKMKEVSKSLGLLTSLLLCLYVN